MTMGKTVTTDSTSPTVLSVKNARLRAAGLGLALSATLAGCGATAAPQPPVMPVGAVSDPAIDCGQAWRDFNDADERFTAAYRANDTVLMAKYREWGMWAILFYPSCWDDRLVDMAERAMFEGEAPVPS